MMLETWPLIALDEVSLFSCGQIEKLTIRFIQILVWAYQRNLQVHNSGCFGDVSCQYYL